MFLRVCARACVCLVCSGSLPLTPCIANPGPWDAPKRHQSWTRLLKVSVLNLHTFLTRVLVGRELLKRVLSTTFN